MPHSHQFNRPLASFQLVQKKLVDASTAATLGLLGALQLGHQKDKGDWNPDMISMMKRNNCGEALAHSRVLLDIFGGNACADEFGVGRHEANLQICNTYEGTYVSHNGMFGEMYGKLTPTSGCSHPHPRKGHDGHQRVRQLDWLRSEGHIYVDVHVQL